MMFDSFNTNAAPKFVQSISEPPPSQKPRSPEIDPWGLVWVGSGLILVGILLLQWVKQQSKQQLKQTKESLESMYRADSAVTIPNTLRRSQHTSSSAYPPSGAEPVTSVPQPPEHEDTTVDISSKETPTAPIEAAIPSSLQGQYGVMIDQMVTDILQGKFRSDEHIYRQLGEHLKLGSCEICERLLTDKVKKLQNCQAHESDELKVAKASRQATATKKIQAALQHYLANTELERHFQKTLQTLLEASEQERLQVFLDFLDPNQEFYIERHHLALFAEQLDDEKSYDPDLAASLLSPISTGIKQGIASYKDLEPKLVQWLYGDGNRLVGFQSSRDVDTPWQLWKQQVKRPLPQLLFDSQAKQQSAFALAQQQQTLDISAWVELIVLLRATQNSLIAWFDKQPYSYALGRKLAASAYLSFVILWCELSNGFQQSHLPEDDRRTWSRGCFQLSLQLLRAFAQREQFPLYGGVFASFSGTVEEETWDYLDKPLKEIKNHQEKARILTILGYSKQGLGHIQRARIYFDEALALARQGDDQFCEIAVLNHISRIDMSQRQFSEAIRGSQQALMLARQIGDSMGEVNAIANYGFATAARIHQDEHHLPTELEDCISRLETGAELAQKNHDVWSQIYCQLGLGLASLLLDQHSNAVGHFEKALTQSQSAGALLLEGIGQWMLAETYHQMNLPNQAVYPASLGFYLLEQKKAPEFRQAQNLITVLLNRLEPEHFFPLLLQSKSNLVARIGLEGFEHLESQLKHEHMS